MATIFEAVAKQSQNSQQSQSQPESTANQTAQHFTGNCVTNGLFLFDEPSTSINMLDNWLLPSKQSRSSLEAAKRKINPNQSGPYHTSIDTVVSDHHIDLLTSQQHFQFQHPQHPHNQAHSLFLSPSNMDTSQLSQQSSSLQQPQQQMQQTDQLQSSPNCSFEGGDATYHFKTLVPAVAAGAIIGKGGETIAAIQKETGARVKMSKSHDFYPGTQERVCLITGSIESIMTVLDFIMDKIREKPDQTPKLTDIETKQAQERDKQVKILVPNSTAGMIIGKAGAYIKQIKEESGSYVQISQKPKDITLQERCITIIGDKENNKVACKLILAKIMEDPSSGTCLNVSYADVNGPVANFNPTGSPYAANQTTISSSTASLNSTPSLSAPNLLVNGSGINLSLNLGPTNNSNPALNTQIIDHIKVAMRGFGYLEPVLNEVAAALGILAKYGSLGVGVGLTHTNGTTPISYLNVTPLEQSVTANSVFGAIGQVNLDSFIGATSPTPRASIDRFETTQFDPFRHAGQQAAAPISINTNTYGLATNSSIGAAAAAQTLGGLSKSPTPADVGLRDSKSVEVAESIVGAILGPNGSSLIDIQNKSGATIQISKKGMFAPGTKNRIVTISGAPSGIQLAHFLIEQKVAEEETKRRNQNTLTGIPGIMQ
ncbi:RNA-binding protein Pasilla isoform X1 [Sitodiplosis mosellana]|uniref:RNA-binding protein Pasilla isoform X1 n=1 Tax=Sitodiplosis mosellana TaxID=263140 RepID=UPI00244443F7|nr:RNA-binding protein Pasilla isoform X1 [Sitodiplosis mosellana]XP_055322518.1 RNA-binding protein Pasilla isoform X1 [Sitodiplosis mosellana]XP_055322519.1 RNA-binding protein Pasilla isoform X1 [Sitodiplosis mosellana]XP_055322520.1 RNA-binding protein Pasilla isoform X1 [Sitodiplosis mosellana]XP_055322521.1 RNA-binding protein Pasilla isoform X1 [Sitodiplosis mosellana]